MTTQQKISSKKNILVCKIKKVVLLLCIFNLLFNLFPFYYPIIQAETINGIIWDAQITFTPAYPGSGDSLFFGEAPDASDGQDTYDTPKSPIPPSPYIYSFFNTTFTSPYNTLWKEYKHYPSVSKTWNFKVIY